MSRPVIAVMSQRSQWTSELPASGPDGYSFVTCDSLEQLGQLATDNEAAGVIADLRNVSGGGHQQEQILERLRDLMGERPVAMVTDDDCPEPLERRAMWSSIQHLRGDVSIASVIDWVQAAVPLEAAVPVEATVTDTHPKRLQPADSGAGTGTVMSGITRRFETFTPELKHMLEDLTVAAEKNVTVLLIGETGAGKAYLSSLIHEVSPRKDEPFVTVACGALPGDLIESELFGHMRGSFTSAHADKDGKFLAAGKGTLLLDEIDVLGPEQQVKLLRVIETGQFEPVGSNDTQTSQARLVVASNLPLEPLVQQGKFRPDLYYRLSMLKFELLPLRKRRPDIKLLAKRFIQDKSKKLDVVVHRIEQEFFDSLLEYPWPGNVRELEHAIQRAVIYCRDGVLSADQLPKHVRTGVIGPTNDPTVVLDSTRQEIDSKQLGDQMAVTEKELIEEALMRNNYNRTKTARELGVSRVTLYNKMKRYGLS